MGKTFKKFNKSFTDGPRDIYEDDYETFGYEVQNAKRTPKTKKVSKFKDFDAYDYWPSQIIFKGAALPLF